MSGSGGHRAFKTEPCRSAEGNAPILCHVLCLPGTGSILDGVLVEALVLGCPKEAMLKSTYSPDNASKFL